jgi:hypothetical protein
VQINAKPILSQCSYAEERWVGEGCVLSDVDCVREVDVVKNVGF